MLYGPVLPGFVILSWDLGLLGFYLELQIFEKLVVFFLAKKKKKSNKRPYKVSNPASSPLGRTDKSVH